MRIKCPICGTEYEEGTVRFCKVCMYSIGTDVYLTNLLNRPSPEDLKRYNQGIEEFRELWNMRNTVSKRIVSGLVEMVEVEGGTFLMGSNDGESDEKPLHKVTLDSYYIGKYEVTQKLWENLMGNNPSIFKGDYRPVEKISWYDAVEFCNKLTEKEGFQKVYSRMEKNITCDFSANGYRLPTEAEWEYAAKGGNKSKGFKYSGSNNLKEVGWYHDNSFNFNSGICTQNVGTKQPNELGIYDMTGNVCEWCWDWYEDYNFSGQTNPRGASSGSFRLVRGGSCYDSTKDCFVSNRSYNLPDIRSYDLGLRVVRTKY